MRRAILSSMHSAMNSTPKKGDDSPSVMVYESVDEFDVVGILLQMRLPPQSDMCNWCVNPHSRLISFGIAHANVSLRLVCSHSALALVK